MMRKLVLGAALLLGMAWPAAAQLGRQIVVQSGTPEDQDLTAIQAATNPHQKLALLNHFAAAHPTGDMALMADELYVGVYSSLKSYTKAYEYGDKVLARDPNNLNVAVELMRDAQLQSDTAKIVSYAVRVGQMVTRYKARPVPAGMSAAEWAQQQQQTLASIQPTVGWVSRSAHTAISSEPASNAKTEHLREMAKAFPSSSSAHAQK